MDKFLSLWDNYNIAIIEGLVALVIFFSLFLAYRSFFAKSAPGHGSDAGHGLDAAQLEKTLQKILDNQAAGKANGTEDLGLHIAEATETPSAKPAAGASAADAAEVAKLKASLNEGQQKIQELQKQVKEALAAAEASAAAAASAPAGGEAPAGGISAKEKDDLMGKIRDLEARLAEYEIISEDIADLSRYREENDNLKKEIDTLKAGAAAAPAAPVPAAAPVAAPEPVAAAPAPPPPPPEPVAAPAPVAEPVAAAPVVEAASVDAEIEAAVAAMANQAAEAPAEVAPAPPPVEAAPEAAAAPVDESVIDDDLMKEFAAAVQGQKDVSAAKKADAEAGKLINEFENFVTKKS